MTGFPARSGRGPAPALRFPPRALLRPLPPPALRRALDARDRRCRFPGCGSRYCQAHHVVHWAREGETRLENLVLLCRRHHRLVHEGGWRVALEGEDRTVRFVRPDGRELPAVPAPGAVPGDLTLEALAPPLPPPTPYDQRTSLNGDRSQQSPPVDASAEAPPLRDGSGADDARDASAAAEGGSAEGAGNPEADDVGGRPFPDRRYSINWLPPP